ncbi:MAG: hypothetical protein RR307_06365, partial [Clostridia bacterium]
SVNTDELEQEGLYPGKILVYRQGSELPKLLAPEKIPADFKEEEERLLAEFAVISGVSDLMRSSNTPVNVTSGIALNLLMEQDDSRMLSTSEQVRNSLKIIGLHILRIYKQFAELPRLFSITDNEGRKIVKTFDASELANDDIIINTENEFSSTPAQQRSLAMELYHAGLLFDENGKLPPQTKSKLLSLMGFSDLH